MPIMIVSVLLFFLTSSPVYAVVLDRVVAVVNDDVITLSELKSLELTLLQQPEKPGEERPRPDRDVLLNELIDKKIKLQKAEELYIRVSDQELEAAIQGILTQNNLSKEIFQTKLKEEGLTWDEYEKEIREQMILSKLINQEIRSRVVLIPEELETYYKEHLDRFAQNEKRHLLRILLAYPESSTEKEKEDRRKVAEALRQRILSGERFRDLAIRFSDGPEASEGGDLGIFSKGELRADLDHIISEMGPGDLTRVLPIDNSYQLIMVEDISAASHTPFEEVEEQIRELRYQEKTRQYYEEWINKLKEKTFVEKKVNALYE